MLYWDILFTTTVATLPPYYVRPEPLYFMKHPQSVTNYLGSDITLYCTINAQTIVSGYEFEMYWTFNGNKTNTTSSQYGQLELHVVLNATTAGRYQCVVKDGLFSIVSEVAELRLFGKDDLV